MPFALCKREEDVGWKKKCNGKNCINILFLVRMEFSIHHFQFSIQQDVLGFLLFVAFYLCRSHSMLICSCCFDSVIELV